MKILPLPALLWAITLGLLVGCGPKAATGPQGRGAGPVPVNVKPVVRKSMPVDLSVIGNIEPMATVDVKAQVNGELLSVHFEEGQEVQKGDLLFSIQPKLYQTQLLQAEANLARDKVQAVSAEQDAARLSMLIGKGAVSKEQLDQAKAQAEALWATVRADEALVEIARVQLGYATVEAPISGRTGAVHVHAGNLIQSATGQALVTIHQMAPIYAVFAVPEQWLPSIRREMVDKELAVTVTDPDSNESLAQGKLTFVANTVDIATGSILLKATFVNEDRALWPGAFVDVTLHLKPETDALVVPLSSVTTGQKGQQVFVVKDGAAQLRAVSVRRTVGQEVVLEEGVEAGEMVVTNGQVRLVPGAKVSVQPDPAESPDGNAPSAQINTVTR